MGLKMYCEGTTASPSTIKIPESPAESLESLRIKQKRDTTTIGDLIVPSVGIGTISWSSKSLTTLENLELQTLVNEACQSNSGALFDTAERYGSHIKTALGLGWGETETLLNKFLARRTAAANAGIDGREYIGHDEEQSSPYPVVATKFTPSPWRTTVESVVEACEQSRQRLGVEQIDLYQLHMPDIVQPLRFLGMGAPKDEIYWEGMVECYRRGLVKNIGVSNYGPTLVTRCQDFLGKRNVSLSSNQIAYSLIGRQNGAEDTLVKCSELGVKVLAYYPFAMGLLTGKYSPELLMSDSTAAETITKTTSLTSSQRSNLELKDLKRYAQGDGSGIPEGGITPLLQTMQSIATANGKTISQVALNYIICKGAIPIPGARSVTQWRDNEGAMGWRLSDGDMNTLEDAACRLGFDFEGAGFKRTSEKFVGYGVEKWSLN
eukprot:CAMPEP_0172478342 /NCGR_PEP_ID=MMETSP1066-20121228/2236_1 /TAXON_ID=671091 /ORGANISM="Coscinodiscus wailesii, Strain CCMP2513" /LENGTH=434 /DNA_ID=CAMNT_0013237831 /DNA_START=263 /DNA_END=1567 /DNA_ORIENTATION=-